MVTEKFDKNRAKENAAQQRELQKINGLKRLEEVGIDPEQYRLYFDTMRHIDIPLKHALPDPHFVKEGILSIEEVEEMWKIVKDKYQSINVDEQEKEGGREIILKMKILVENYTRLLEEYKNNPDWKEEREIDPPEELIHIREEMLALANEFNNLPAYLSYCLYGMYEIDPDTISPNEYFRNRPDA